MLPAEVAALATKVFGADLKTRSDIPEDVGSIVVAAVVVVGHECGMVAEVACMAIDGTEIDVVAEIVFGADIDTHRPGGIHSARSRWLGYKVVVADREVAHIA